MKFSRGRGIEPEVFNVIAQAKLMNAIITKKSAVTKAVNHTLVETLYEDKP